MISNILKLIKIIYESYLVERDAADNFRVCPKSRKLTVRELKFPEAKEINENVYKTNFGMFDGGYLPNRSTESHSVFFYTEYEWRATTFVSEVFDESGWFMRYEG